MQEIIKFELKMILFGKIKIYEYYVLKNYFWYSGMNFGKENRNQIVNKHIQNS